MAYQAEITNDGNTLLLSDIKDALYCQMCLECPNNDLPNKCKHGHKICSYCDGSVHTHGCLRIERSKLDEEICKYDSGYFEVDNDIIKHLPSSKLGLVRMTLDSQYFFGVCWRDVEPLGFWHMSLYIVGSPKEAREYIFTTKICDENYVEELSYTAECVPINMEKEEMIAMGRCLTYNDETVKRFCCDNNKLNFYFQIFRNPIGKEK